MKRIFMRMKATGACPPRKAITSILWSWLGSFLGIYLLAVLGQSCKHMHWDTLFLIGSFGASAVLVYGGPAAEFSQPRNLVGGHVISALIGVTVLMFTGESTPVASAMAVSLSIGSVERLPVLKKRSGSVLGYSSPDSVCS